MRPRRSELDWHRLPRRCAARNDRLYGEWMRLASGAAPQPNLRRMCRGAHCAPLNPTAIRVREGLSSRGSDFCDRGDPRWSGTDCHAAARLKRTESWRLAGTGMVLVSGIGAEGVCRKCRRALRASMGDGCDGYHAAPLNQTYSACHPLIFTFYK